MFQDVLAYKDMTYLSVDASYSPETQLLNFLMEIANSLNGKPWPQPETLLPLLKTIEGKIRCSYETLLEALLEKKQAFETPTFELHQGNAWLHSVFNYLKRQEANSQNLIINAMSDLLHYNGSHEIRLGMIAFLLKGLTEGEPFHYAPSAGSESNRLQIAQGLSKLHQCSIQMRHVFGTAGERHAIQILKSILKGRAIITCSILESAWTENKSQDIFHFNPVHDKLYRATPKWIRSKFKVVKKKLSEGSLLAALVLSEIEQPIPLEEEKKEIEEMISLMREIKRYNPQILFICDRTQNGASIAPSYWEIVTKHAQDLQNNMVLICSASQYFTAPASHAAVIVTQNASMHELLPSESLHKLLPIAISQTTLFADILGQFGFGYALQHRTPEAWCKYHEYHAKNIHFLKTNLHNLGFSVVNPEYYTNNFGSSYVLANFNLLKGLPTPFEVLRLLQKVKTQHPIEPTILFADEVAAFLLILAKVKVLPISKRNQKADIIIAINSDLPMTQLEELLQRLAFISTKANSVKAEQRRSQAIKGHPRPLPTWILGDDIILNKPRDPRVCTPKNSIKIPRSKFELKEVEEFRTVAESSQLIIDPLLEAEIPGTSRTSIAPSPMNSTKVTPFLTPHHPTRNSSSSTDLHHATRRLTNPERTRTPSANRKSIWSSAAAHAASFLPKFSFVKTPSKTPDLDIKEESSPEIEDAPAMEGLWDLKETALALSKQPKHPNAPPLRIAGIGVPNFPGTQEIRFGAIIHLLEGIDGKPIQDVHPIYNNSKFLLTKAFSKLWNTNRLNPSMIFDSSGGTQAIKLISEFLRGKAIIAPSPLYMLWYGTNQPNNVFTFSVMQETGYSLNAACLDKGFKECSEAAHQQGLKVGALVLVTPENPTPGCLDEMESRKVIQVFSNIVQQNPDILFILDHAYFKLSKKRPLIEIILNEAPKLIPNVVTCETGTKITSASGLRSGCIITLNQRLQAHLVQEALARNMFANTSVQFGYAYCLYRRTEEAWQRFLDFYSSRRKFVNKGLEKRGLNLPELFPNRNPKKTFKPEGSFYILADFHFLQGLPVPKEARNILVEIGKDFGPLIETDKHASLVILTLASVMLARLSDFDESLAPAMILRITCADSFENLEDILHRIDIFMAAAQRYRIQRDLPGFLPLHSWITSQDFYIHTFQTITVNQPSTAESSPLISPKTTVARSLDFRSAPQLQPSPPIISTQFPAYSETNLRSLDQVIQRRSMDFFDVVRPALPYSLLWQYPGFASSSSMSPPATAGVLSSQPLPTLQPFPEERVARLSALPTTEPISSAFSPTSPLSWHMPALPLSTATTIPPSPTSHISTSLSLVSSMGEPEARTASSPAAPLSFAPSSPKSSPRKNVSPKPRSRSLEKLNGRSFQ